MRMQKLYIDNSFKEFCYKHLERNGVGAERGSGEKTIIILFKVGDITIHFLLMQWMGKTW